MRRENRRRPVEDGLDTKKVLYVTGSVLALAVIVFVITFLLYSNQLNDSTQLGKLDTNSIGNMTAEETSNPSGKTVNEMQSQNTTSNNISNETNTNTTTNTTSNNTSKVAINTSSSENKKAPTNNNTEATKSSKTTEKIPDPEFIKPVQGDIMKEFAENKLVYSSTLDVWATHNGIDIQAEKTSVVKASAEGTVISIKNDPRYGLTVIIEHVNGYKTVYANLLSTEFVVEGEKVKQGQSIGTIGNTASFEISDEPHLHFELLKNDEQQDPELYLK